MRTHNFGRLAPSDPRLLPMWATTFQMVEGEIGISILRVSSRIGREWDQIPIELCAVMQLKQSRNRDSK